MAIIIQEEKRKINWFALAVVIAIIAAIAILIYYLFFSPTPLIEKVAPPRLQSLKDLSSIKLNPQAITQDSRFQILKKYTNPIETGQAGKANPFAPTR